MANNKNTTKNSKQAIKFVSKDGKEHEAEIISDDWDKKPMNKNRKSYRDERGVRIQTYRRFKEDVDYEPINENEMSAIIGMIRNQNNTTGRGRGQPRKYEDLEEFRGAIDAFWDYISDCNEKGVKLIPDIEGFCAYIGINRSTLNEWEKSRDYDYSAAIKNLKNQIAYCKKQLALNGKIPPIVFATDFNNNHGYVQKQEPQVVVHANARELMSIEQIQRMLLPPPKDDDIE